MKAYWIEHEYLIEGTVYECSRCGNKCRSAYIRCPLCESDMSKKSKYKPDFVDQCALMDILLGDD